MALATWDIEPTINSLPHKRTLPTFHTIEWVWHQGLVQSTVGVVWMSESGRIINQGSWNLNADEPKSSPRR